MNCDETPTFSDLMVLVRQGDAGALTALLEEYGEAIRREIRFTLLDRRLRRFVGDSDVYQSVVLRFFSGIREGRFEIESAEDLTRLFKGIARTRIAELVRFWHAQRRDLSRTADLSSLASVLAGQEVPPRFDALELSEIVESLEGILTPTDRQIVQWRGDGVQWSEIARRLSAASGDAVRKQHRRAMALIARHLAND